MSTKIIATSLMLFLTPSLLAEVKPRDPINFPGITTWGMGFDYMAVANGPGWRVRVVTRLDDLNPPNGNVGDFRWATRQTRTIVLFDTAGIILLKKGSDLTPEDTTIIAGQSAPFPGIQIKDEKMRYQSQHDWELWHMTLNVSDSNYAIEDDDPQDRRCLDILSDQSQGTVNGFVGYNTLTGGTDGIINYTRDYPSGPVAFVRNAIGEPMDSSRTDDVPANHGATMNIRAELLSGCGSGDCTAGHDLTLILENFIFSTFIRSPHVQSSTAKYINNYGGYSHLTLFDWDEGSLFPPSTTMKLDVIGNYWDNHDNPLIGMQIDNRAPLLLNTADAGTDSIYWHDNLSPDWAGSISQTIADSGYVNPGEAVFTSYEVLPVPGLTPRPASTIREHVLNVAGARRKSDGYGFVEHWKRLALDSVNVDQVDCSRGGDRWVDMGNAQTPRTTSTWVFVPDANVSNKNNRYVGYTLRISANPDYPGDGPAVGETTVISTYTGATRTATLTGTWSDAPTVNTDVEILYTCRKAQRLIYPLPSLTVDHASLIPADLNADDDGDGYPNIIDYIQDLRLEVEDVKISP